MSQSNEIIFQAADISKRFKDACSGFDHLLASAKSEKCVHLRHKLRDDVKEYRQKGPLSIAFVGQYSAGKSTILSALTGRRDIHIDADIATDQITHYDWNNIKIIDTPGLFTDRQDHDDTTYDAIAKADLLVFCLTHMLFDTLTVENFKKLAYDQGYRWKMMLVVNKMSAAAGDEAQKIASYRHSLAAALKPHGLSEFPICFIDAKDYCEGIDEDDDFLTDISRFDTFVTELNQFVARRAHLASLDTPIRIVLGCIDEARIALGRNSDEDNAFLEIMLRLSRRINRHRERLRAQIRSINLKMTAAIMAEGDKLTSTVGDAEFEQLSKHVEDNVREHYEKAGRELETVMEQVILTLQSEVDEEIRNNLTQAFVAQLNFNGKISAQNCSSNSNRQQLQIEWLQRIGEQVEGGIAKAATRGGITSTAKAGQGFLRSMDVAQSSLHQTVLQAGKVVGFKFKPWQAVGIAKNIGNAAKFIGPVAGLITVGAEMRSMYEEQERERNMAVARSEIVSQFKLFAIDLEQQIKEQLLEFESQSYNQIEKNIAEACQQTEAAMSSSSTELSQLANIRQQLELILSEVQQAAMPPIL